MISYNLAPIPIWPLRDNLGEPLANGYMLAYRDLVRSDFKPVYQDIAGLNPYVQPIVFNAAGFQGPFYWASDENYYIEIFDSSGNLVKTVSAYNAPSSGGSGPITIVSSNRNYIQDSQFRFIIRNYSPVPAFVQIGSSNWFIEKNNTTAVDSLEIIPFILGSTNPPHNPPNYLRYDCAVPGNSENTKDLYYRFQSVYSFQNTEVTFAFWAKAQTGSTPLKVVCYQNFGTGVVSPPVVIYPATFSLTTNWAQYSITFTVPSVSGKTIGGSTDFLGIGIQYPLDAICQVDSTNFQLNSGNTLQPFDYLSATNDAPLQVPFFNSSDNYYYQSSLSIDENGILNWKNQVPIGTVVSWVAVPGASTPPGDNSIWVIAAGQSLPVADYPYLFQIIGYEFGGSGANFNLPDLRGIFIRGLDAGRGVDPSRAWGSLQGSANASHAHFPGQGNSFFDGNPSSSLALAGGTDYFFSLSPTTAPNGINESRPINIALIYIIKIT